MACQATTRRENATAVELLSNPADAHDAVGLDVANDGPEVLSVTLGLEPDARDGLSR